MNTVPNRRARRAAMKSYGFFKSKNNLSLKDRGEMRRETMKRGKEIFEANRDAMEKSIADQLEKSEERLIANWKEMGYNDQEIEMLREANAIITVRDADTWHQDKKTARRLMKEASELKNSRMNS